MHPRDQNLRQGIVVKTSFRTRVSQIKFQAIKQSPKLKTEYRHKTRFRNQGFVNSVREICRYQFILILTFLSTKMYRSQKGKRSFI